ncbi:uncharacterized protein EV420DRAFT_1482397 [Desarmillaria tabescens]|uniref:Uncharacterized protein n=1 Tax=Armillaria tabescens TaxID=1929756 RepID=A0AA39MYY7_ARMTA|nr:uncharacterized protein EV420DRAFT_1482397 [Desarmillaria tabescens]KAK0452056.1 hypothetical protein EV420DRAFT_1482397 [Desarmillaria tabescens]
MARSLAGLRFLPFPLILVGMRIISQEPLTSDLKRSERFRSLIVNSASENHAIGCPTQDICHQARLRDRIGSVPFPGTLLSAEEWTPFRWSSSSNAVAPLRIPPDLSSNHSRSEIPRPYTPSPIFIPVPLSSRGHQEGGYSVTPDSLAAKETKKARPLYAHRGGGGGCSSNQREDGNAIGSQMMHQLYRIDRQDERLSSSNRPSRKRGYMIYWRIDSWSNCTSADMLDRQDSLKT